MSKQEEHEAKKELILSSAIRLFDKKQFHEIGMRDIALEAGISSATIYKYFSSREDLFVEALINIISAFELKHGEYFMSENATIEELIVLFINYLLDNESTFQLMSYFMITGKANKEILEKYNMVQRYFLSVFDNLLVKSGATGKVRLFSHVFFASLAGIVMAFRNYPGRGKEEIRKHMHRLASLLSFFFKQGMPLYKE